MSVDTKITCDCCNADLTETGSMPKFSLRISAEEIPHSTDIVFGVLVYPPIGSDKHFCDLKCMHSWLSNKLKIA